MANTTPNTIHIDTSHTHIHTLINICILRYFNHTDAVTYVSWCFMPTQSVETHHQNIGDFIKKYLKKKFQTKRKRTHEIVVHSAMACKKYQIITIDFRTKSKTQEEKKCCTFLWDWNEIAFARLLSTYIYWNNVANERYR